MTEKVEIDQSARWARFTTKLVQGERKNVVGIIVPATIVEALGGGKRPPVKITINGYTYRSTVAVMGGNAMVGVASEHRVQANVVGGDTLKVQIERDTDIRTVEIPVDLVEALAGVGATAAFEALAFSHRKEHIRSVNDAKTNETRQRRIDAVIKSTLAARK